MAVGACKDKLLSNALIAVPRGYGRKDASGAIQVWRTLHHVSFSKENTWQFALKKDFKRSLIHWNIYANF